MKTAFVVDWIIDIGGGEKVNEIIYQLYPSDVFCLVSKEDTIKKLGIPTERVRNSFISKLPMATKHYRNYLPFFPLAIEQFDLSQYDVVISSSHAVAKGVLTRHYQLHICYCHTPMRYAWDLYHQYLREANLEKGLKGKIAKLILHYVRIWDVSTANRVDYFIANSKYTAKRIKKIYNKDAQVIYPPVDVKKFTLRLDKDEFYVTASRMVPYKMIPIIVEAFTKMPDKKLIVIGDGPDFKKVQSISEGYKNIEILGYVENNILVEYLQKAKAFVFAAEEDFGILPVEVQSCGTPVIAFGKGGAVETVIPGKTGVLFHEQTPDSIVEAVKNFEKIQDSFDYKEIRKHAEYFSVERFREEFKSFVDSKIQEFFDTKNL